ncbi:hypothetical protein [Chitinophaga vietnamensis]|uniref:hypothetical protein n=1 Tax=Chitinophaga vietnamensis TaxID=2593957 RepID=UPI001178BFC0|nr:hypothetical protein [Chitinophaga vietnamensis]
MLPTSPIPGYDQVFAEEHPLALLAGVPCKITTTDDSHNHTFQLHFNEDRYVMKQPRSWSISTTFLIVFCSLMMANVLAESLKNSYYYLLILPFSLAGIIIERMLRPYFNKKLAKEIVIAPEGISLDAQYYPWTDISGTFIVERIKYRYYKSFLVLALKNGSNVYASLNYFQTLDMVKDKVATAITHFKPVSK